MHICEEKAISTLSLATRYLVTKHLHDARTESTRDAFLPP